jgi:hypothetical protein
MMEGGGGIAAGSSILPGVKYGAEKKRDVDMGDEEVHAYMT